MQGKHLFEYAIIRVVPRVEREEFLNVGVILYCKKEGFLKSRYLLDEARLKCFAGFIDLDEVKEHLNSFDRICNGDKAGGAIAQMDIASRFRWLTATRSKVVKASKVHPGFAANAADKLTQLFEQLVA